MKQSEDRPGQPDKKTNRKQVSCSFFVIILSWKKICVIFSVLEKGQS